MTYTTDRRNITILTRMTLKLYTCEHTIDEKWVNGAKTLWQFSNYRERRIIVVILSQVKELLDNNINYIRNHREYKSRKTIVVRRMLPTEVIVEKLSISPFISNSETYIPLPQYLKLLDDINNKYSELISVILSTEVKNDNNLLSMVISLMTIYNVLTDINYKLFFRYNTTGQNGSPTPIKRYENDYIFSPNKNPDSMSKIITDILTYLKTAEKLSDPLFVTSLVVFYCYNTSESHTRLIYNTLRHSTYLLKELDSCYIDNPSNCEFINEHLARSWSMSSTDTLDKKSLILLSLESVADADKYILNISRLWEHSNINRVLLKNLLEKIHHLIISVLEVNYRLSH